MVAIASTCAAALDLAAEVEVLSEQYYKVSTLGAPHILDNQEMSVVLDKFRFYGPKPAPWDLKLTPRNAFDRQTDPAAEYLKTSLRQIHRSDGDGGHVAQK